MVAHFSITRRLRPGHPKSQRKQGEISGRQSTAVFAAARCYAGLMVSEQSQAAGDESLLHRYPSFCSRWDGAIDDTAFKSIN